MSDLRRIGTADQSVEHIEDAEYEEVGADQQAKPPLAKRRGCTPVQALIGGIVALALLIALANSGEESPASSAPSSDAQTMLSTWTERVTGSASDAGLRLVDGSGNVGSDCNSGNGTRLLSFGGQTVPGTATPLYDYFSMDMRGQDNGIAGAFRFDANASTLTIRNAEMLSKGSGQPIPDATYKVRPSWDGTIEFRGLRYHACKLP